MWLAVAGMLLVQACSTARGRAAELYNAGQQAIARGDLETAIVDFDGVLASDPAHVESLRWRAWCRVVRREFELALADLDRALRVEPRDAWTHYERGVMFEEMGDGERAVDSFTRAIELDPTHFKSFQHRGWTLRLLGEHARAVEDLSRAIELTPLHDPDMSGLLYARSQSLFLLGRTGEAQRDEQRLDAIRNSGR